MLTIFEIAGLRRVASADNGKLDLFKALALETRSLFQALLGVCKLLILRCVSHIPRWRHRCKSRIHTSRRRNLKGTP